MHGLIFETSVWLLAESTRFLSSPHQRRSVLCKNTSISRCQCSTTNFFDSLPLICKSSLETNRPNHLSWKLFWSLSYYRHVQKRSSKQISFLQNLKLTRASISSWLLIRIFKKTRSTTNWHLPTCSLISQLPAQNFYLHVTGCVHRPSRLLFQIYTHGVTTKQSTLSGSAEFPQPPPLSKINLLFVL